MPSPFSIVGYRLSSPVTFFVERSKQGKKSDGNLPMTRFRLVVIWSFFLQLFKLFLDFMW